MTDGPRRAWLALAGVAAVLIAVVVAILAFLPGGDGGDALLADLDAPYATLGGEEPVPSEGEWAITEESMAGYRVEIHVGDLPMATDAVGRTEHVSGGFSLDRVGPDLTVPRAAFTVDVSTLESGQLARDEQLHAVGLETDRFPTASFVATETVEVPPEAELGEVTRTHATGDLTVHGVTRTVSIAIDVARVGNVIEIVGTYSFPMSDFDIDPPTVAGVVTVADEATLEFRLLCRPVEGP